MAETSDEELLEGYFAGNVQAFEIFFRRHLNKVTGYAVTHGIPGQDAMDVAQEVFSKLHRNIEYYDPRRPALPWFFTIVRNVCLDWHRTRNRKRSAEVLTEDVSESAVQTAENLNQNGDLSEALAGLTTEQRAVVQMRLVEDMNFEEISARTAKTEGAMRKLYERAIAALSKKRGVSNDKSER